MIWFLTGAYQNFTMVSKFAKNVTSEKCNVTFRVPKGCFSTQIRDSKSSKDSVRKVGHKVLRSPFVSFSKEGTKIPKILDIFRVSKQSE